MSQMKRVEEDAAAKAAASFISGFCVCVSEIRYGYIPFFAEKWNINGHNIGK